MNNIIPHKWEVKKFDEIFDVVTDYVANGSFASLRENVSYKDDEDYAILVRLQDYSNKFQKNFVYVDEHAYNFLSKSKLNPNDLVICNVGAAGIIFKVPDLKKPMTLAPNSILVRTNESSDYMYYYIQSSIGQQKLKDITTTTAQPKFNKTDFKSIKCILPPLKEQQKIASILSSVDAAIEKTEQVITKTEEVKKGLMQQLLTKGISHTEFKQTTIGEIPVEWEAIKAKDIFSNVSIKNNYNEELLSVTQENGVVPRKDLESRVTMPEGSVKSYKLVVPGDFIISLRSFQGGLELSKIRGIVSPAYTILQSRIEIDEEYFKYFFKSMWFINRLNSAVIGIRDGKQISYSVFSDLYFPIPPLNEQRRISNILNNIDKRLYIEKGYLNQQQQIKQGLMQQLLTGKTRVKEATMYSFLKELGYCE